MVIYRWYYYPAAEEELWSGGEMNEYAKSHVAG